MTFPIINIHAQEYYHQPGFVVGNRAGLESLRALVDRALGSAEPVSVQVFAGDGEGFPLYMLCTGDGDLVDAPLGYTAETARHDVWDDWS